MIQQIPTPQDDGLLLQANKTPVPITASANTASYDFGAGFAPGGRGLHVVGVIDCSLVDRTTGDETYTAKLQESADNATFTDCGVAVSFTAAGVIACDGIQNKRYSRIAFTLGGTTPILNYVAWLNLTLGR